MRFLIVGASGFIGQHLLAHVQSLGLEVVGTQSQTRFPGLVKFDLLKDRITDCVDRSFLEQPGPLVVVICACISLQDRCFAERELTHKVNVEQTIRLIDDVRVFGAKIVFFSTSYVFDGSLGYYTEEHPLSPINEYSRQKIEVERYLQANESEALIFRLDKNVGDRPNERHQLAEWYELLLADQPIICIEGQLLSPTYVGDTVHAVMAGCQKKLGGLFHLANSEFFYRDELARQFCYAAGKEPRVICRPLKDFNFLDGRATKSYLDGSKFANASGLRFTPMREVFRRFFQNANQLSHQR